MEGLNLKELFIDMYCPLWIFLVGSFGLDLFQVKIRLRLSKGYIHGKWSPIALVTVFDAILTSRQTREKLQCLYENLMSNNFRRAAILKKHDLETKASLLRILLKKSEGVTCARRPRSTFFYFPYICL